MDSEISLPVTSLFPCLSYDVNQKLLYRMLQLEDILLLDAILLLGRIALSQCIDAVYSYRYIARSFFFVVVVV